MMPATIRIIEKHSACQLNSSSFAIATILPSLWTFQHRKRTLQLPIGQPELIVIDYHRSLAYFHALMSEPAKLVSPSTRGALTLENIDKNFDGSSIPALRDVS